MCLFARDVRLPIITVGRILSDRVQPCDSYRSQKPSKAPPFAAVDPSSSSSSSSSSSAVVTTTTWPIDARSRRGDGGGRRRQWRRAARRRKILRSIDRAETCWADYARGRSLFTAMMHRSLTRGRGSRPRRYNKLRFGRREIRLSDRRSQWCSRSVRNFETNGSSRRHTPSECLFWARRDCDNLLVWRMILSVVVIASSTGCEGP